MVGVGAKQKDTGNIKRKSKILRQNTIENRAISVFSGQKSGTRIILNILQSFLHFLKAKDINNCLT